jgi:hypothetical protein
VYLAYYEFQSGEKEKAYERIAEIVNRESDKFRAMPPHDAVALVGPGLCYAIHQWALFFAMEGDWRLATQKALAMEPFAMMVDENGLEEAKTLLIRGEAEAAFHRVIDSIRYRDGE